MGNRRIDIPGGVPPNFGSENWAPPAAGGGGGITGPAGPSGPPGEAFSVDVPTDIMAIAGPQGPAGIAGRDGSVGPPGDMFSVDVPSEIIVQPQLPALAYPSQNFIRTKLAPRNWWNANNTVDSGGLVDTLTDIGTTPKNFSQVGAARATPGVDANGQRYLTFAGAQYYQAGVAADWTFANDGTGCTFAFIGSRQALATTAEALFGTASGDTTKRGFDMYWGFVSAGDQGPALFVCNGTLNQYVVFAETAVLGLNTIIAVVGRTFGATPPTRTVNGVQNNPAACDLSVTGQPRSWCARNVAYSVVAPTFALTLGRRADLGAGQFLNGRVYDVVVDSNIWSDAEVDLWLQYARTRQGLAPQSSWPQVVT